MADFIRFYTGNYKYQLACDYTVKINIVSYTVRCDYYELSLDGTLLIFAGYAWDGATLCPDFKSIIRGSLIHDVLYQMIRQGQISTINRTLADKILKDCCVVDGMYHWFAVIVFYAVRKYGSAASLASHRKRQLVAP